MEKRCTLKFTLVTVTLGLAVGTYFSFNYLDILSVPPFTEHYQSLIVSFSFSLLFKEKIPLLTPFVSSFGLPPFFQEFFQPQPFDLGSWRIVASFSFTIFLVFRSKAARGKKRYQEPNKFSQSRLLQLNADIYPRKTMHIFPEIINLGSNSISGVENGS